MWMEASSRTSSLGTDCLEEERRNLRGTGGRCNGDEHGVYPAGSVTHHSMRDGGGGGGEGAVEVCVVDVDKDDENMKIAGRKTRSNCRSLRTHSTGTGRTHVHAHAIEIMVPALYLREK